MGDLSKDTEVVGGNGTYRARLSEDWEIWGPQGGYVATVALRAAGDHSAFKRPATFYCHYLSVARFGEVDLTVESLRESRRAESVRVSMTQDGKMVMEALVWLVDELEGIDHLGVQTPPVPPPQELKNWAEWYPEVEGPPFRFWYNLEGRPVGFDPDKEGQPAPPFAQTWYRFVGASRFEDPLVDAGRLLIGLDVSMYPAATRAHGGGLPYVAPSIDLAVTFHQQAAFSEWFLVEAESPLARSGLTAGKAQVWSEQGELLATGIQQMLQKPV